MSANCPPWSSRQARQKGALHSGRESPCPRSQDAGALWHHRVGALRPWASAGRGFPAGFLLPGVSPDSSRSAR